MNEIKIEGNIGREPEFKERGGKMVCQFSVATSNDYKSGSEWVKQPPTWHTVQAWGDLAEACRGLSKGDRVMVIGKQEHREYEGKWYSSVRAFRLYQGLTAKTATPKTKDTKPEDIPF